MNLRRAAAGVLAALTMVLAGCSGSRPTMATPSSSPATTAAAATTAPPTTVDRNISKVATAIPAQVNVYLTPDASTQPGHTLSNPNENGAPLVFLVEDEKPDWYHVYLPVRPNGSNGWVQAKDVDVQENPYRLVVSASNHQLTLEKDGATEKQFKVGIGRGQYPTPGGVYYIKELLAPPNPQGDYGPYAYGLSGFSEVKSLENFAGGNGVIGIHGTNNPSSVGQSVSHGCIRMYNSDITELAKILPLGTPVTIES